MSLQDTFENAVKSAHSLNDRPSNDNLLKMYGLYKQATEGDNNEEPPGGFDFKAAANTMLGKNLRALAKKML